MHTMLIYNAFTIKVMVLYFKTYRTEVPCLSLVV